VEVKGLPKPAFRDVLVGMVAAAAGAALVLLLQ
jgi:hypothetical protein